MCFSSILSCFSIIKISLSYCFWAELIRSLHVYRLINGEENEVEREFVFSANGTYVEMEADPLLRLQNFQLSEVFEGFVNGLWVCIFAFHAHQLTCNIPSFLTVSRYPFFPYYYCPFTHSRFFFFDISMNVTIWSWINLFTSSQ